MLKFLINGTLQSDIDYDYAGTAANQLTQIWNLGHIFEVLRNMIKYEWWAGIIQLFTFRKVRQLFASVNDVNSFIDTLFAFLEMITEHPVLSLQNTREKQLKFIDVLMSALDNTPYNLIRCCLAMYV